jgi:hypothetical protein
MSGSNGRFTVEDANERFAFEPGGAPEDPIFFRDFLATFKQVPGKPAPAENADLCVPFHIKGVINLRLPTSPSDILDANSKIVVKTSTTVPFGAILRCRQDLMFANRVGNFAWRALGENSDLLLLPSMALRCVVCSKPTNQNTSDGKVTVTPMGPDLALLLMVHPLYYCCTRAKCMAKVMQAKLMTTPPEHWRLCASCKKYETPGGPKFPECARCRLEVYCGKDCQQNHWPAHRKMCKQVAKPSSTTSKKN